MTKHDCYNKRPRFSKIHQFCGALFLSLFLLSCSNDSNTSSKNHTKFTLATDTNITFSNDLNSTKDLNILNYLYYYNGAGVALGDFNNDGLDDLYFTSNQTEDELYLNKGNLKFENINSIAGIHNNSGWTTGVTTVDINNDGLLDLYISKVSNHLKLSGNNLLYVNQGVNSDGYPIFQEKSEEYGLDLEGLSSQASFFDFDLDGDLDVFILRHSLYPNSNYGSGTIRKVRDTLGGDLLLENVDGTYVDASAKANIFSSRIGYGLGISISDINGDGYPDIYIGNDFFENDYLYINQKDGTFKEVNSSQNVLGHTSHFSMGNAIEDINNDHRPDIISVDMLPENLETLKSSGQEYNYAIFQNQLRYGYEPQFMQNTLHLNLGDHRFSETAFASGIAATEWSWAPLVADFDNDGLKDLYITNGILGASNDMDFISFISDGKIQRQLGDTMTEEGLTFINELPEKKTPNYFFKNINGLTFENKEGTWHKTIPSLSNGATYGDLDNDGDLDIIVNNINEKAFILENTSSQDSINSNYLHLKFKGSSSNSFGIGAKVQLYVNDTQQLFQNYTTTGYLSAKAPSVFAGLGNATKMDSLHVIWPGGAQQTLSNTSSNQTLLLDFKNAVSPQQTQQHVDTEEPLITAVTIPLDYKHNDNTSIEFSRDPLVPYATTNLGPKMAVGDLNSDALDDLITLGGKNQETTLQIQTTQGLFSSQSLPDGSKRALHEDIDAVIFDANGDEKNDILIVSGGNEFTKGAPLRPRLYFGSSNGFERDLEQFSESFINASSISSIDIDNDQDQDIVITANAVAREFGKTPAQYIYQNDGKGNFSDITDAFAPDFKNVGNVYDIEWKDLNDDNYPDAIVVGHWMPISIFLNTGKELKKTNTSGLENTHGWWNTLAVTDFDNDGDLDIIAGNWGLNTRLKPTFEEPVRLYRDDFDNNGQIDPVVTYMYDGKETTIATKDEMVKQLPFLNKKFLSYTAFAKADIKQLLGAEQLENAQVKKAYEFASIYFENKGDNTFKSHALPFIAQIASIQDILVEDFDNDGYLDALLVGNLYEISTQLGRLDGSHGVLLKNDQNGGFTVMTEQPFDITGASRSIEKLKLQKRDYFVISRNNDSLLFLTRAD